MNTINISFTDILSEIEKLTKKNPEGFTIQEMSAGSGHTTKWCRNQIRKMIQSNTVKYNGKATRLSIDDRPFLIPVYIFIGNKKKSSKR